MRSTPALLLSAVLFSPALPAAPLTEADAALLLSLDLEDLLEVEVTSVAKKAQKLSESAAAVFVITREDIRRSGVRSIPEALRMVPGVQVARINSYAYAIAVRGFNSSFSNKLLVLMDGRSVYTPEFSGVYWDMVDYPLDDIERIEVIRGPGGTLWGSNAVNGIINIITRSARDTQGTLFTAGGGGEERYFATLRHGGQLDADGKAHFRVYAKTHVRDDFPPQALEPPIYDDWRSTRVGFRVDVAADERNDITVQGDFFDNLIGEDQDDFYVAHVDEQGVNLLTRWTHRFAENSETRLQVYSDYLIRDDLSLLTFVDKTLDVDFQHYYVMNDRHELLWGLGYRQVYSDTDFAIMHDFDPVTLEGDLFNLYAQDEISLIPDELKLTVGAKFEHHYYTGWEIQPSMRLLWQPAEATTWWGAVSRAVRTPSRFENTSFTERPGNEVESEAYAPYPINIRRISTGTLASETLTAYELGVRRRFNARISLDGTLFFNDYRKLVVLNDRMHFDQETGYTLNAAFVNGMDAEAYGLEIAGNWLATDWWRLYLGYSWSNLETHLEDQVRSDVFPYEPATESRIPAHQLSLRSGLNFGNAWEVDVWLRYVDELAHYEDRFANPHVDSYTELDLRLAWHVTKNLELSVTGRNLLNDQRQEFATEPLLLYFRNEVEPSVYGQVKWTF